MDKVIVMMSTYNGEKYLREQIDSILAQENVNVQLYVRDDGSKDQTLYIMETYCKKYDNIRLIKGENIGYIKSFMWLVQHVDISDQCFYAFSDQDDIWAPQKMAQAINLIKAKGYGNAVMYYSDLNVVDKCGKFLRQANTWEGNIDKYKIAAFIGIRGCTMVFNSKLAEQIQQYEPADISGHDTYISLLAFWIGTVVYDSNAYIDYRQTGENLSITGENAIDKIKKNFLYVKKRLTVRANIHEKNAKEVLAGYEALIDEAETLKIVANYKETMANRINLLRHKEYFQFSPLINLFNIIFILIGKF